MTNYWSVKDWLVSYKTNILHAMTDSCLRVPSAGRSGDLHSEPRAVLQEVLRFHHHYPVIVSRCDREHRGTWERKGKWGVEQGKRCEGEKKKNHQEAELLRCCDGFVSLSLIRSPSSSLHLSLSLPVGCHTLQLKKKKKHHPFTFNLSSVFC